MEIILTDTQEVISLLEFRKLHPTVSFPDNIQEADLSSFGAAVVTTEPEPTYNRETEVIELLEPTIIESEWVRTWSIQPKPVIIPTVVTMRQARLALLKQNLLSQVEAALTSLPSPEKEEALIEWEYATEVQRESPLVQSLATGLGLNETSLDDLFKLAASL
jgi:hypothetical protein